ncbi:hypothetical protein CVT25_011483 [Psilocybe cyanescens]|uniref:Chromo domain-containing protein n=1 Tax=Psilocybe cyanescens TaxID=93625 RepID=A0A409XA68_PSICY|nr:hypothetical protein CVT25_011483 [Psilocybe cyanescens]
MYACETRRYTNAQCAWRISQKSPAKKIKDEEIKGSNAPCARPHCLLTYVNRRGKGRKSQPLDDSSFVVEAFVGRHKKVTGGHGVSYEYLVKWLNYGYDEATVQTIASMQMSNPGPLLEAFEKQAAAEGIDLDNAGDTVLLREAAEAGWTDNLACHY